MKQARDKPVDAMLLVSCLINTSNSCLAIRILKTSVCAKQNQMRLILGFWDISLTLRIYNNLPVTAKEPAEDGT